MTRLACVVTTIQPPTACVRTLAERLPADALFLAVGDRKGPASWDLPRAELLTLEAQGALPYELASILPVAHYARKNLGYLEAIARGATCLFETDDDNAPLARWTPRERRCDARLAEGGTWLNAYSWFTDELVWPRGLPLSRVRDAAPELVPDSLTERDAPIQQALADGAPDVDATWRLILERPLTFRRGASVLLPPGSACPFNSQATWWWEPAFPLLYLPSRCSFRMTDIWRSFVAQRCLWELGLGIVFHEAEMLQERNEHDLMRDFADEVPGYLANDRIMARLRETKLEPGPDAVGRNMVACWRSLAAAGLSSIDELPLAEAWLADVTRLMEKRA
jgi:hypothetical protein